MYNSEDEQEEEECDLRPCFDVDLSLDIKGAPTTGEEYLVTVIKERRNMPAVSRCDKMAAELESIDEVMNKKNCDGLQYLKSLSSMTPCHTSLIPSEEWIDARVQKFTDMREYVSYLLDDKTMWPEHVSRKVETSSSRWNWNDVLKLKSPTLSLVLTWDNPIMHTGLDKAIELAEKSNPGDTLDPRLGEWVYSLMSCIQQPLLPEDISKLRSFARKCSELRASINHEDENAFELAAPYSLFICIVSKHFRQRDLGV